MSGINLIQALPDDLHQQWLDALNNRYGGDKGLDRIIVCLLRLLSALDWQGSSRQIVEAFPEETEDVSVEDVRDILVRLGLKTTPLNVKPRSLAARLCPCLFVSSIGRSWVVLARDGDKLITCDGSDYFQTERMNGLPDGTFYVVEPVAPSTERRGRASMRLRNIARQFAGTLSMLFCVSFVINVLSLVVPLSIMVIYDQIIGKNSLEMLPYLIVGVGGAAMFELSLRTLRARAQAYIGARVDYLVASSVLEQILHLAPGFTERAPIGGQVTRIREFEAFREAVTGGLPTLFMDLPFVLIFFAVILMLGGPVIVVPLILALAYLLLGWFVFHESGVRTTAAGHARSDRFGFLVELMWWMRTVKRQGAEDIWSERFRRLSANAAWSNHNVARLFQHSQSLSQGLVTIAGAGTLAYGVFLAIDDEMTMGALIATMMLVWRVLQPLQALFGASTKIEQLRQSARQLESLLEYSQEQEPGDSPTTSIQFEGRLEFNRVSMRYSSNSDPALLGVSFTVEPGEIVGVIGRSGAGKSTLSKLALGFYTPQAGAVTLDGVDIRQLKPITLRQTLAYVPQNNHAFPGSLYDNLILSNPIASFEEVKAACRMAGFLHKIEALPFGFDTRFRDGLEAHVPQGFLRQLALARAFLRKAPVVILDEPASGLDDEDERAFLRALELLRGRTTTIMITQRPSHMRICDRLLLLENGQVVDQGPPGDILARMNLAPLNAA
ncbi:MAG: peptidase domain-containing ABC transporter [Rhodospirillaceae bacterium]|jgi:ATP-binding cassette, subfamily C, bacterial LapB|nr:peptidase domain-containing ABC transporter [Rhodospirillaceae bacterium]MBT5665076.1 peptidase domain-containing ABC transporter [Rhodospirillaceae bacterium]MBT5810645.1 peptidase domain-containing ABC transporter [Rhodospirillaceae bacterium]